jgi:hypothetical protein
MFKEQVFWKDGVDAICNGGLFYRAFDLVKFLEKVEADTENGGEVVGLKFDGNNLEIIVKSQS